MSGKRLLVVIASFLLIVVAAAAWLDHKIESSSQASLDTIDQLEIRAKHDRTVIEQIARFAEHPDPEVRVRAISVTAGAAFGLGEQCPMATVRALEDQDELVREVAASSVGAFSSFSDGAFDILRRAARSPNEVVNSGAIAALRHAIYDDRTRNVAIREFRNLMESESYSVRQRHNAMIQLWNLRADDPAVTRFVLATDVSDFSDFADGKFRDFLAAKYVEILKTVSSSSPDVLSDSVRHVSTSADKKTAQNCAKILARLNEKK